MRTVVLDTETTGMPVTAGHRVIEIGCVEVVDRHLTGRHFHYYLQPDRPIDEGATAVHGIRDEDLLDKPHFVDIADEFFAFVEGSQLVIHNAAFDIGFLDNEFVIANQQDRANLEKYCEVIDSLALARHKHPGQRNTLDALCKRYGIDNSGRVLHGALLDAEILADVYLAMTGGQSSLAFAGEGDQADGDWQSGSVIHRLAAGRASTRVIRANAEELAAHQACLAAIEKASGKPSLWAELDQ